MKQNEKSIHNLKPRGKKFITNICERERKVIQKQWYLSHSYGCFYVNEPSFGCLWQWWNRDIPATIATAIAEGNLDPSTMEAYELSVGQQISGTAQSFEETKTESMLGNTVSNNFIVKNMILLLTYCCNVHCKQEQQKIWSRILSKRVAKCQSYQNWFQLRAALLYIHLQV